MTHVPSRTSLPTTAELHAVLRIIAAFERVTLRQLSETMIRGFIDAYAKKHPEISSKLAVGHISDRGGSAR